MIEVETDFSEMDEVAAALEELSSEVQAQIPKKMEDAILILEREAKTLAPVGVSGNLRSKITHEVRGVAMETVGATGPNVEYASPVELGTDPFWPPWGPGTSLARWAELKGLSAFLVARAISRRGIRAQRYLQRAFENKKDAVIQVFVDWIESITLEG